MEFKHPTIQTLFNNLDKWRHFAGYPLEPRVDALFGLFLPQVLAKRYGVGEMCQEAIPQFPIKHIETNRSYKTDFFALSKDGGRAFLIELKTDIDSRRTDQNDYLRRAKQEGMARLLYGIREIAWASKGQNRKKYLHLIYALSKMGLISLPSRLEDMMLKRETRGSTKLIRDIHVSASCDSKVEVVFVQPKVDPGSEQRDFRYISFCEVAKIVEELGELGGLFASYLKRWQDGPGLHPPQQIDLESCN